MEGKVQNTGVVVQEIPEPIKKIGLIYVPDSVEVKKTYKTGVVKATGQGTRERPMEVSVGDKVKYKNNEYPKNEQGFDVVILDDILYVE